MTYACHFQDLKMVGFSGLFSIISIFLSSFSLQLYSRRDLQLLHRRHDSIPAIEHDETLVGVVVDASEQSLNSHAQVFLRLC